MTSHSVHDAVLRFITDPVGADFEHLALEVFAHQFEHIPAYRRVCERRGQTPTMVSDWRAIPPVPTLAFKEVALHCGPVERCFVTSGTTQGGGHRGQHAMPDLRLYQASAIEGMREFLFPDVTTMRILSLIPAVTEQPQSSLAQMASWALEHLATADSGVFARSERFDFDGFEAALRHSEESGDPVCILTTTGALLRFFDHCRDRNWSFRLPHSSRLMDTGGTKGAPRVLSRPGLLQACWNVFAIPGYFVANEYGMTELSSQFYDNVIRDRHRGKTTHRAKTSPLWMRTRVLDPVTLREVPPGERGLLCHTDLANAGTALVVLTEDLGHLIDDGFEIIGRVAGAEARGCSLSVAEFVS